MAQDSQHLDFKKIAIFRIFSQKKKLQKFIFLGGSGCKGSLLRWGEIMGVYLGDGEKINVYKPPHKQTPGV